MENMIFLDGIENDQDNQNILNILKNISEEVGGESAKESAMKDMQSI